MADTVVVVSIYGGQDFYLSFRIYYEFNIIGGLVDMLLCLNVGSIPLSTYSPVLKLGCIKLFWECDMLIKDRDAKEGAIEQLRDLQSLNLSPKKRFLIERELKNLSPGEDGGKNASHFINFYCADARNWAIIHDLKIEHNGFATHIDHLLINHFLDIYLFESKNYTYSLKITADGQFLVFDGCQYQSVESPLEENEKRIQVLRKVLIENKIIPKRIGIPFRPSIKPYVLVSPKSKVLRPPVSIYDTSSVITADFLINKLLKQVEKIKRIYLKLKRMPKAIKSDTLADVAGKLASLNKPNLIDYQRLFCPDDSGETANMHSSDKDAAISCDYAI
jgi:hypothetical protein